MAPAYTEGNCGHCPSLRLLGDSLLLRVGSRLEYPGLPLLCSKEEEEEWCGEMSQWLTAQTALAEDPSSIPSAPPPPEDPWPLYGLLGHLYSNTCASTYI